MMRSFQKFLKGFKYAFQGICIALGERNMRVHVLASMVVLIAAWYFQVSQAELLAILIMIGAVMAAEIVNTSVEKICNTLRDCFHCSFDETRAARDLAAGAVLILALTSVFVAIVIFVPKIALLVVH